MTQYEFEHLDLDGKSILVTGGTGSFGRAFIAMVLARFKPRRLIVFSRDEAKQHDMANEYGYHLGRSNNLPLRFFIGDVRDQARLEMAMREVDIVVHAAALKHVPAAEYNPMECIRTNVHGAENVVTAALSCGVGEVVALSTDKAVNPINLYGASKLAADKVFIAANNLSGRRKTRFSVVRYGNVLGSRGSVVPFFRQLAANGADHLPITDERMTRFWITVQQGVSFVLSCLGLMTGGEIFIPKMPSMRIIDLAACVAPDLPVKMVGIRPGEKLHEVMLTEDDARFARDLGDRYVIVPEISFTLAVANAAHGGTQVPDGFRYASNTNDQWLAPSELSAMLEGI